MRAHPAQGGSIQHRARKNLQIQVYSFLLPPSLPLLSSFLSFTLELIYSVESLPPVQHSDPVIHIHTLFFSYHLPSWSIPRDCIEFPVLYGRTSLLIHSSILSFDVLLAIPTAWGSSWARDRTCATAAAHPSRGRPP